MKATILTARTPNIFLGILAIVMLFSFVSCTKKISFLTSSVVPAARGTVKVKKDKNMNYVIQIELLNLAEVKRLNPARETYVVWMVTDVMTKNIGKIDSSSGMFSNKLKASFETISSIKPTKIFITAEDDASVQYSGSEVVMSTSSF